MMPFDPAGPLPTGTVVLEASAGTGKTHAIAALATRYLAEGEVSVANLAVISFSRAASEELRSRVRQRLRRSAAVLEAVVNDTDVSEPLDATDAALIQGDAAQVRTRLARLRTALVGVDSAGIMTIHQFCQLMFTELGVLATEDPEATLADDLSLLLDEVVADLYLARYAAMSERPFDLRTAHELARAAALQLPMSPLVPRDGDGAAGERLEFAAAVRSELDRRKRRQGVFSYDDQLLRLRDALQGPNGQAGAARLRQRCRVVLVDEFQDTDPVQWGILRDTFAGRVPLVLIGDPKQAIYAFRGADVNAYTEAVAACDQQFSLATNYRADQPVVSAVTALFGSTSLGPHISVERVQAKIQGSRLSGAAPAPVRLRYIAADKPLSAAAARQRIQVDLVAEVVRLLDSGIQVGSGRHLAEKDIAVLVNTNRRGREVAAALSAAGVAVAFSGSDSVFAAPAAADWLSLLRALDQPHRTALREAILSDFVGADLTEVATADDSRFSAWAALLQGWGRLLAEHGIAALFAAIQSGTEEHPGLAERLVQRRRGERDLTDFRHIAEILHAHHRSGIRGAALVSWLANEIERSEYAGDRTRRLETDRQAVPVMTVHKAKGLEFPVVLLPQMADLWLSEEDTGDSFDFHDENDERVLDVGGKDAPGRAERRRRHAAEQAEDRLRSLYVAATRAQSQLTLWWAPTARNTESSPLHRLLYRDRDQPGSPQPSYPLDAGAGLITPDRLTWLTEAGIAVEPCSEESTRRRPRRPGEIRLTAPSWNRSIDPLWRRTSYSGLTAAAHDVVQPAASIVTDEPVGDVDAVAEVDGPRSPMADLPGGTAFGSLVHHILENLDWQAPSDAELDRRLLAATTEATARYALHAVSPQTLAHALKPALLTPLGPLTDDRTLADFEVGDRLSELDFEFPLGTDTSRNTVGDIAAVLRRWLPADDPLADYPDDLESPALSNQVLRGFLTGSIDSVLRVPGPDAPRFVVVDYKTNRLGPTDLRLNHYRRPAMTAEMRRSHYPLQALLYCVALHRFLAARLADYRPEAQLGGVGYLFVRGMGGVEAGPTTGVFDWHPPTSAIVELSELLADRSPA
jgi:exodeoxyribonuclease V beta subunit